MYETLVEMEPLYFLHIFPHFKYVAETKLNQNIRWGVLARWMLRRLLTHDANRFTQL